MSRARFFALFLSGLVAACAKSSTVSHDGGVDSGPPAVCGDQVREAPEECDDGNSIDDDVCANDCTLNPICGDGVLGLPEECDDGNNHSGDGCSGRCQLESCGNMRLDPGEVCDGTPGCLGDCSAVTTCGNGGIDLGEQCDDGNSTSWDGCSASCEIERAAVLSELDLLTMGPCDLNGDGYGDSALGIALELAWTEVGPIVGGLLTQSPFNVLVLRGVDDPSFATNDPSVRVAWVRGVDANGAGADFDGTGQVTVDPSSLVGSEPLLSFPGSITAQTLDAGPEDVSIPFYGSFELGLRRARIVDTMLTVAGTSPNTTVSVASLAGTICGAVEIGPFASLPSIVGSFGLPGIATNSCDPITVPDANVNLADLIVGGVKLGTYVDVIVATQPDVDMDGDGFEQYVVASGTNCQPVIVSCIDGDGTAIAGHDCSKDPRMQDAISAAFDFTAPTTTILP